MPGSTFRELLQSEPGLAQALLPRLTKTIRALTTRVYEFSTLAVNNRIQAELLRLASLGPKDGKMQPASECRVARDSREHFATAKIDFTPRGGFPRPKQ